MVLKLLWGCVLFLLLVVVLLVVMSVEFFFVLFKVVVYGYCGVSVLLFEYILVLYV